MRSRNLFLKPRSSFHARWWIIALLLAGLYFLLRTPNERPRDELPWQPPIEPNGVMVRDATVSDISTSTLASAAALPATSEQQPQAAPPTPVAEASTPPAAPADAQAQVRQTIEEWSRAWSARDVNAYLGMYGRSFAPEGGQARSAWEQTRRQRILSKSAIAHEVRNLQITLQGNKATARFEQTYTADRVRSVGPKTLRFELESDKWRIVSESTS